MGPVEWGRNANMTASQTEIYQTWNNHTETSHIEPELDCQPRYKYPTGLPKSGILQTAWRGGYPQRPTAGSRHTWDPRPDSFIKGKLRIKPELGTSRNTPILTHLSFRDDMHHQHQFKSNRLPCGQSVDSINKATNYPCGQSVDSVSGALSV